MSVRAIDPVSGQQYLFLPGGAIEAGESPATAAIRETLEETGFSVRVAEPSLTLEYEFEWTGKLYDCRTSFFQASLLDSQAPPAEVNDAAFLHGVEWVPVDQIDAAFAYHPVILRAVRELVSRA